MSDEVKTADILGLTAQIVSAHVAKNRLGPEALPALIESVYRSLSTAGEAPPPPPAVQAPAVPIKKSVYPDYIICLEDGKKLKMLKRHLQASYGMSPEAYRAKWGLPRDYPMVAPNYAATRSGLAKKIGLGRKVVVADAAETESEMEVDVEAEAAPAPAKKSRRRAAKPAEA